MMLFYDYFMVYGTNTIGDHDGVESFLASLFLFCLLLEGDFFHVVLTARTLGGREAG